MSDEKPWVVIAGGGTAGHVLPALAVAEALREDGVPVGKILFVGSRRGIEARLVGEAGFPILVLPGRGIRRALSLDNIKNVAGLGAAFVRAVTLLVRKRPAVVFSVGGYASVPCSLAAVLLRIPLVLAESNARAGLAIRSVARFAKATATAFAGTGLPRAVVLGNPVRASVVALGAAVADSGLSPDAGDTRRSSRAGLGMPLDVPMVGIFGGSLGARHINETVYGLCERWNDRAIVIHHVVGERDFESAQAWLASFRARYPTPRLDYRQIRYEDRMDLVYGAADLVVCRAGATSIADLAIVGMPAILIPLPSAAEDHQSANAEAVAADGACVHVRQSELSVERLATEIDGLLRSPGRRQAMAAAQRNRARPGAAQDIAALLERFAARPAPRSPVAALHESRTGAVAPTAGAHMPAAPPPEVPEPGPGTSRPDGNPEP
jgi:UDP-N-acetylglucosamine--N-acetylmuramyl-(pentapeptide) pyrophosphoryl-undecaprenol N-acetylglucosamine transferase